MGDDVKQVLVCKNCSSKLSEPVQVLVIGSKEFPKVEWRDQEPISAKGVALETMEPMQRNADPNGPKADLEYLPQFWMRLDDILESVGNVEIGIAWQGCCGPSQGIPNRNCTCGEPVGIEMNDCWTAKVFIPAEGKTRWQNVKL